MTLNLHTALALIGIAIVIAIYLFSKWRRWNWPPASGRKGPAAPASRVHQTEAGKSMPSWGVAKASSADANLAEPRMPPPPDVAVEGVPTDALETSTNEADASSAAFQRRAVDGFDKISQIDYWVKITGERDVGRETVLAIYHDSAINCNKPLRIHGLKTPGKAWCDLLREGEDSRFSDLVATIQLADGDGAVSLSDMAKFSDLTVKLSAGTGRECFPMASIENALAQGAAIAAFIQHFAAVFVVKIRPGEGGRFSGGAIEQCAAQIGLERDHHGYYSRFKSVGKNKVTLYSLADLSETGRFDFNDMKSFSASGLIFFTKPAVNHSPGAVFTEMVDTAKSFASRMKGVVDSPEHADLSQDDIDGIRQSIQRVAAEMAAHGIPAGSDEAVRIF